MYTLLSPLKTLQEGNRVEWQSLKISWLKPIVKSKAISTKCKWKHHHEFIEITTNLHFIGSNQLRHGVQAWGTSSSLPQFKQLGHFLPKMYHKDACALAHHSSKTLALDLDNYWTNSRSNLFDLFSLVSEYFKLNLIDCTIFLA